MCASDLETGVCGDGLRRMKGREMMEFLPREVLAALHEARKKKANRASSRLHVEVAGETWRILRRWRGGFALDAAKVTHLRGNVNLFDGPRHEAQCLIVASEIIDGELICTSKRETKVSLIAPVDFERQSEARLLLPHG
jgi:hypothetical protein